MYNAGFASSYELYKKFIKPYYSITKECIDGSSNSTGYKNCGYKEDCLYTYDGTTCSISISNLKILLVLADGSVLAFRPNKLDLSSDNNGVFAYYWSVYYDENGPKQPNRFGRDIFIFALNPFLNKIVPVGLYQSLSNLQLSDKSDIDNRCITLGDSCSARILLDGWKIKY